MRKMRILFWNRIELVEEQTKAKRKRKHHIDIIEYEIIVTAR